MLPAQPPAIQITADLTEPQRHFFHAEIDIPVHPGPTAITAAAWIPGHHATKNTDNDITGLVFTANRRDGSMQTIPWRRDDVDLYKFHLTVPAGVTTLHAHLDYIVNIKATNQLAVLEWEDLMLYPAGVPVRNLQIQPSVLVPAGWHVATSLTPVGAPAPQPADAQHPQGATLLHYAPLTVEMLEDSPVFTGLNFHEYPLTTTDPHPVFLDVFGDSPEDVELRPSVLASMQHLVPEAEAMYGSTHYNSYRFLLTLTKNGPYGGLEHHQSSDNSLPNAALTTDQLAERGGPVLSHEYTHSWNGKYRRPAGLYTADFATPMKGDLLWVYEGLTDYLGNVLGARIGFLTPAQYRDYLAATAADLDNTAGRQWRSTDDTAVAISGLQGGSAWANWRRGADYYPEGDLVWLDVDTTLRKLTGDKKSLHDFMLAFVDEHGSTPPEIVPYTFEELVATLNSVVPYGWAAFLRERVYTVQPHVNTEGIEQGGWRLVYTAEPNLWQAISFTGSAAPINVWYSLGLRFGENGAISDVRKGSPADLARLAPGDKILGIGSKVFSSEALTAAVKATTSSTGPITLTIQNDTLIRTAAIPYQNGPRYPHLIRIDNTPDYLDEIARPLTPVPAP